VLFTIQKKEVEKSKVKPSKQSTKEKVID